MFVRYLKSMSVEMVERVERVSGLAVDIAHDYGMAASDRAVAGPVILPIRVSIHLVGWHQACGQFLVAWPAGLAGKWQYGKWQMAGWLVAGQLVSLLTGTCPFACI